MIISFLIINL